MKRYLLFLCIVIFSISLYSQDSDCANLFEESKKKILQFCKEYKPDSKEKVIPVTIIEVDNKFQENLGVYCQSLSVKYEKEKSLLENYKNFLEQIQSSKFTEANSEAFEKEIKSKLEKKMDSIINKYRNQLIDTHLKYLDENDKQYAIQIDTINIPSIALTFLLFIITFIFVSIKNKNLIATVDNSNKEISELKKQVSILSNSTELKGQTNRLSSISQDIEDIKDDLISIHKRVNERSVTTQKETFQYPQKQVEEVYEEYFFSNPTSNGDFTDAYKKKNYIPNESIYRFLVHKNGTNASFTFIDEEAAIKTAIRIASSYIEPVCENVNPRNPSAKSIITVEQGIAVKEGNVWKVTKKAKIRYE
jgi:uncharacterized protein YoxC